jgi:3-oxoadipate enol-lactonase
MRLRSEVVRYASDEAGAEEPLPITFLHGVGGNLNVWDDVLSALPNTYETLRYDLRGHGFSSKPAGPYQLNDFVNDHILMLNRNNIEKTHLVGFSLGGLVAQSVALKHSGRVGKLILISTVAGRSEEEKAAVRRRLDVLKSEGAGAHLAAASDRWFTPEFSKAHPEVLESRRRISLANDPEAYVAAYEVLASTDLVEDLPNISHETLVITGECDPGSTPRMARRIAESIPGAEVVVIPRMRHSILLEKPDEVAELIQGFIG